jgi:hypothetical protein
VTTRHLDLGPLIQSLAQGAHELAFEILSPVDEAHGYMGARWILLTPEGSLFERPRLAAAGHPLECAPLPRPWTDDYSNLLQVLK